MFRPRLALLYIYIYYVFIVNLHIHIIHIHDIINDIPVLDNDISVDRSCNEDAMVLMS